MQTHYIQYGRRHRIPSTVEILDELRSGYLRDYVRKSWAQFGFTKPESDIDKSLSVCEEALTPPSVQEERSEFPPTPLVDEAA